MPFWEQHITPTLGPKATRQFVKATLKPSNWLGDTIIKPRLFRRDAFGGVYYPVDLTKFSVGRSHFFAELIASDPDPLRTYGRDPWVGLTLFANPLRLWNPVVASDEDEDRTHEQPDPPKHRVVLGDYHIFTYEFDVPDRLFLKEQLSWLRSSKNQLDCAVGDLYRHCSRFGDFAGITANHSGNKSLHIHVTFSTGMAEQKFKLQSATPAQLRKGFVAHWEALHEDLLGILKVPSGIRADEHLRFPESFRRVPNGSRVIEPGHLLGFPSGTTLPQVTLWEKARERAAGDEMPLFFRPEPFQTEPSVNRLARVAAPSRNLGTNLSPEEVRFCEDRLTEFYPHWPRFDHLSFEADRWVAKFRNSEADRNPSSVMREDFSTVHMVGRDAAGLTARWLPYPLGHMLRFWCAQYRVQQGRSDEALTIEEVLLAGPEQRVLHPLEDRFRANVTDSETARTEMEFFFRSTVSQHPLLMVVGPEGVGKTSVLMALHHEFVADLERRRESTLAMYVFDDYADAATKCTAFNDVQAANGFIGVVIPSFSRAYEEECAALGITAISTGEAAHRGFTSRWKAISALQPSIIERLRARCTSLWASIGDKKPVFFSVHQVAHGWRKSTPSRLMWSRAFWEEWADDKERLDACRKETKLGLLVHDEAKAETIVDMQPFEIVQWVEDLVNSDTEVWCAEWRPLPSLLASYEAFVAERGDPVVAGNSTPITFEEVRRIEEVGYSLWDHVETADSGEYGCRPASNDNGGEEDGDTPERRDIYAARHGRSWGVSSRHWWRGAADRVVLLTTEAVPTALARVADSSWAVFELETPNVPRDTVEVHASRFVRGDNLATICADFRDEHPDDDFVIISNRVAMMTETVTHAGARGSNDLIGRNVMQTMTFMTPGEYERLQALNAWTGRSDLVSLRHVDEFNQSAGRNLGFRRRGEVKHVLLVNRRLFGLLVGAAGALTHSRYDMRLHLDADERYEIKRAA